MSDDDRIKELEAACAAMRFRLEGLRPWFPESTAGFIAEGISEALSSDAGKGWKSPKEYQALEAACAAMRSLLDRILGDSITGRLPFIGSKVLQNAIVLALSSDAGKGLLAELEKYKQGCQQLEMAHADAMSLVLSHEGHIEKLLAELEQAKEELERYKKLAHSENIGHQRYKALNHENWTLVEAREAELEQAKAEIAVLEEANDSLKELAGEWRDENAQLRGQLELHHKGVTWQENIELKAEMALLEGVKQDNARLRSALEFAIRCAEGNERDYAGTLVPTMKRALEKS